MNLLRLAYSALYLIALIAVYVLWSQVGGQGHLDLVPWYIKLILGSLAALAVTRATAASVSGERGWNGHTLRWLGFAVALLVACGLASYYSHLYLEDTGDEDEQSDTTVSSLFRDAPCLPDICAGRVSRGSLRPSCFTVERHARVWYSVSKQISDANSGPIYCR
jgi:hypothetical protein